MEENNKAVVLRGKANYAQVIETLTPEEKNYYLTMCESVSINDRTSLQVLGADIIEANSRTANSLLSTVRSNDNQIIKDCLADTVKQLNLVKPSELDPENKWRNFLMKIPIVKNIVHSVENMQIMANTAEDNVNIIFDRMKASSRNLSTNNSTLEQMYLEGDALIEHMNELILALQIRRQDEENKLEEMKADSSCSPWEIQKQATFIDAIKQDIANKMVSVQDMENSQMMICTLQSTNDALINACGVAINQTLPQWKKSIAMAIQASETKNVVESVKLITDKANQIILDTADAVAYSATEAAKQSSGTVVKIQTLEQAQKKMFDAMKQVKRIIEDSKNSLDSIERGVQNIQSHRNTELKSIAQ